MTAEQTRTLWSLVYLVGFAASYFLVQNGFSETLLWSVWIVVLLVSHWNLKKTWGKVSPQITQAWKAANGVFVLLSLALLLGLIPGTPVSILAVYLLVFGALKFVMGHELKAPAKSFVGLMSIGFGLVATGWFADTYFLAAALLIGFPMLLLNLKQ